MWKLINILHKSWRLASKHNDIKTWKMCLAQRNVHVSIRQWCLHDGAHLEGAAVKGQPPDPTCWLLSFQMMFISLHIIIDINYVQNLSKSILYNSLHWIWTDYVPDVHLQCIPLLYILHLSKSPKIFLWYPLIHDPFLYISMIFPWYFFTSLYPLISHDLKMSMISHDIWNIPPGLLRNTCTGVTGIQQRRLVSEAAEGQRFLDQTGGLVKLTLKQFMRENLSGLSPKMRVTLTEWFFRTRVSANIYESGLRKLSPESPDSQLSVSLSPPFRSLQRVLSDNVLLVKYRQLGMPSTRYHSLKIAEQHQGSPLF